MPILNTSDKTKEGNNGSLASFSGALGSMEIDEFLSPLARTNVQFALTVWKNGEDMTGQTLKDSISQFFLNGLQAARHEEDVVSVIQELSAMWLQIDTDNHQQVTKFFENIKEEGLRVLTNLTPQRIIDHPEIVQELYGCSLDEVYTEFDEVKNMFTMLTTRLREIGIG